MLIIRRSGCGKTSLLLKMLLVSGWLYYDELYVCNKSLNQPDYRILKAGVDKGKINKSDIAKTFNESNSVDVTVDEYIMNLPKET